MVDICSLIDYLSGIDVNDSAVSVLDKKNIDVEDASLDWTTGKNLEVKEKKWCKTALDRIPRKQIKDRIWANCQLIKTVDADLLPDIATRVYRMIMGKMSGEDFIDWCIEECGVSEGRACVIAMDQVKKIREQIKIQDWKNRHIEYVIWRVGDSKEHREYHESKWNGKSGIRDGKPNGLNGYIFRIDNPPVIDKETGMRGFPSDLIGCKCFLTAVRGEYK